MLVERTCSTNSTSSELSLSLRFFDLGGVGSPSPSESMTMISGAFFDLEVVGLDVLGEKKLCKVVDWQEGLLFLDARAILVVERGKIVRTSVTCNSERVSRVEVTHLLHPMNDSTEIL